MIQVEDREQIRRAYFVEHKSIRAISRELKHSRATIREALASGEPRPYHLKVPRAAPVLGPFTEQLERLLVENASLPRKQRYTAHKIFELLKASGYLGSEGSVRRYVALHRATGRKRDVYLPLEYDPGVDAQADWGEAVVIMGGAPVTVQLFVLRLCYSRKMLVRAYPTQNQESFFEGHVAAFQFLEGVPQRIWYDNLSTAVRRVLEGHHRDEQRAFVAFRSEYLFESRFCTPAQGHEKGGVESGVGYARRNFLVPLPEVTNFEALNAHLRAACEQDTQRTVARQAQTMAEMWAHEQPQLRPRPAKDFECCVTVPVTLNPYSQVVYATNRYSVPVESAYRHLVLKAYPFRIAILYENKTVAEHPRCYDQEQDILVPQHYLPLLEQRPGAFDHAKPLRQWRAEWSPVFEELLAHLQAHRPEGAGIPEFVRILKLHRDHPAALIEQAVTQALAWGCAHLDGVTLCLHQLQHPETLPVALDLGRHPQLAAIGQAPVNLRAYEALLEGA
jgi:transposase